MLATKLRLGAGTRWESQVSAAARILPLLAADGALVRGRPRTSWANGQYRWVPAATWLVRQAGARRRADGAGGAPAALARRLRPGDRDRHPLVDGLDGEGDATGARHRAARGGRARRRDGRRAGRRSRDDEGAAPVGRAAPDARFHDDGLEAARLVPRAARTLAVRLRSGNAGPTVWWDGRVVGGWSQRADGEIVFRLLEDVGSDAIRVVEAEAERLRAWLGDTRLKPSFLPLFQRRLATG